MLYRILLNMKMKPGGPFHIGNMMRQGKNQLFVLEEDAFFWCYRINSIISEEAKTN